MIDHLHIKNFMCFKELEIPTLKRVNLIAGKNNSGKTTLLDAVRILKSYGDNAVINDVLSSRKSFIDTRKDSYRLLFHRKSTHSIEIDDIEIHESGDNYYVKTLFTHELVNGDKLNPDKVYSISIDDLIHISLNTSYEVANHLWENIVLTPKEDDVYEILRDSIQPDLIRLDVGREIVRVRLEDTEKPVPLGTLGDGVYRILLIALSLANAQNSILLIDELELGLHYSALEKLWNMIFKYAQKWDIQVFATTHSQDVLRTFHYVADNEKYINDAQYIRLQINRKGENEAIIFDGERLRESLELQLEIR